MLDRFPKRAMAGTALAGTTLLLGMPVAALVYDDNDHDLRPHDHRLRQLSDSAFAGKHDDHEKTSGWLFTTPQADITDLSFILEADQPLIPANLVVTLDVTGGPASAILICTKLLDEPELLVNNTVLDLTLLDHNKLNTAAIDKKKLDEIFLSQKLFAYHAFLDPTEIGEGGFILKVPGCGNVRAEVILDSTAVDVTNVEPNPGGALAAAANTNPGENNPSRSNTNTNTNTVIPVGAVAAGGGGALAGGDSKSGLMAGGVGLLGMAALGGIALLWRRSTDETHA